MIEDRVKKLEKLLDELDGRCLMQDILIAHLLGSVGSATGDMQGFVEGVLARVASDIHGNGVQAVGTPNAQRFAYASKTFEGFSLSIRGSVRKTSDGSVN